MQKISVFDGALETVTPLSAVMWEAEYVKSQVADSSDRVVCVMGEAAGGTPFTPYIFTDPIKARKALLSGDLLRGIEYAFSNGAADGAKPRAVVGVNVRGGTPASYVVKDAANKTVFTLQTRTYREGANQTALSISGSRASGFSLQVRDPLTGLGVSHNRLGVGLYVQYVGGGSAATAEVTEIAGQKYFKTTVTDGGASENLLLPVAGLTVNQLAQQIQQAGPYNVLISRSATLDAEGLDLTTVPVSITGYVPVGKVTTAVVAGGTSITLGAPGTARAMQAGETIKLRVGGVWRYASLTASAASAATTLTIAPVAYDIPAGAVLLEGAGIKAPAALSAVKADIKDFLTINGAGAVTYLEGDPTAGDPRVQAGLFTGGGSSPATLADWEEGVEAALEEDFASLVAITDDQGIAYGIRARLQAARQPQEGKFVQFFAGVDGSSLPSGESASEINAYLRMVTSITANINDRDSVLVAQSVSARGANGRDERIAPKFVAAMLAGHAASIGRAKSLTYKTLAATDPYPNLKNYKDDFTLAGVTVLVPPKKSMNARVELGRTAYVGDDNTIYEAEKSVRLMNSVTREVKIIQEHLVPGEANKSALARYDRELRAYMDRLVTAELIQEGYDQEGNFVPPYEVVIERTTYQGRKVSTKIKLNPVGEFVVAEAKLYARPVEIEL